LARATNENVFENGIADASVEWPTADLTGDDRIHIKRRL